jgi:hypothetical protein
MAAKPDKLNSFVHLHMQSNFREAQSFDLLHASHWKIHPHLPGEGGGKATGPMPYCPPL